MKKLNYNQDYTHMYRSRKKKLFSWGLILEIIIILIQPIPFLDIWLTISDYVFGEGSIRSIYLSAEGAYFVDDFLLILMFLRLIILTRNFFNYSPYSDVFAKRLCDRYGFTANIWFCFKCYILSNPIGTVLCLLTLSILILSYI